MLKINNISFKFVLKFKVILKLTSFLKFLWRSTNQHGVHSPFVFNLVTRCFYSKTDEEAKEAFKKYKKQLLNNNRNIIISDFGAGSKLSKSNIRSVKSIAKTAGISTKRAELLIRLIAYFKPNSILELGTSLGLSTYCLHLGNKDSQIITMEGCPNTAEIAKNTLSLFNTFPQIVIGNMDNLLTSTINNKTFDFVYIDGNHQKKATITYFENILNAIHNDSVLIFDDIHWSKAMEEAWELIRNHPKVTVSIDTYQWGIVFFRKEQEKEHFIIRV